MNRPDELDIVLKNQVLSILPALRAMTIYPDDIPLIKFLNLSQSHSSITEKNALNFSIVLIVRMDSTL